MEKAFPRLLPVRGRRLDLSVEGVSTTTDGGCWSCCVVVDRVMISMYSASSLFVFVGIDRIRFDGIDE